MPLTSTTCFTEAGLFTRLNDLFRNLLALYCIDCIVLSGWSNLLRIRLCSWALCGVHLRLFQKYFQDFCHTCIDGYRGAIPVAEPFQLLASPV